ncbi:ABC transporter substrate-binding protein [uncultured Slackia sp.]|uniref:ABC transporter substrate-binding protein n=1 Tax=uncultured Slackia sp. TaxID=665903 RepID=UPI0025D21E9E|nr:ABC transporter substrate-binding protein [uncultured Slackia sp.]
MLTRRKFAQVAAMSVAAFGAFGIAGCSSSKDEGSAQSGEGQALSMKIGTLQTEDSLPFWVAEANGMYADAGLDSVEIITFQSAQELSTAFAAGEIDGAMTDAQVSAALAASGTAVNLAWVTLGATPEQGRFGIMTSPESGITSLTDLAGKGIGVGSNTVPEYVMDRLMEAAGVPADQIVGEEIKKLPVRYESMANNQVAAAALPGSLLALGEASGMVLLADDTQGDNISQSVFAVSQAWIDGGGQAALDAVRQAWDAAVDAINADPESFRALLVEKANLPELVADTYSISTYPEATLPTAEMVDPVLAWMQEKGYLTANVAYDAATGALAAQ